MSPRKRARAARVKIHPRPFPLASQSHRLTLMTVAFVRASEGSLRLLTWVGDFDFQPRSLADTTTMSIRDRPALRRGTQTLAQSSLISLVIHVSRWISLRELELLTTSTTLAAGIMIRTCISVSPSYTKQASA